MNKKNSESSIFPLTLLLGRVIIPLLQKNYQKKFPLTNDFSSEITTQIKM